MDTHNNNNNNNNTIYSLIDVSIIIVEDYQFI